MATTASIVISEAEGACRVTTPTRQAWNPFSLNMGHNNIGHTYTGHNYIGLYYIGHKYMGHKYTGHTYIGPYLYRAMPI